MYMYYYVNPVDKKIMIEYDFIIFWIVAVPLHFFQK